MSACIGASAAGARTYTATASQGLLFMAEALYNAVRPRAADRDDGRQPRDRRADQHLERPLRRDVAARLGLDPALRGVQPGGGRPARPGVPARRGALAAGDGLHGRLRPHPRVRARRRARRRSRSTPSCRRSSRARCSTRTTPVTIGAMVGPEAFTEVKYLAHAKQMQALDADPGDRRRLRGGVRPRLRRARPPLPDRGRRDGRRRARLGARHDRGRRRRAARRGRERSAPSAIDLLPPVAARRGARARSRTPSG